MRLIDAEGLLIELHAVQGIAQCFYKGDGIPELIETVFSNVFDSVNDSATIDPVQHGQWIDVELVRSYGIMKGIRCSCCGKQRLKGSCSMPNFCEECGADMRAENGNGVSG